ncbi:hypothetical protein PSYPI_12449, partial [Pseudomonas syringae pv. pisi str. 1704B]
MRRRGFGISGGVEWGVSGTALRREEQSAVFIRAYAASRDDDANLPGG